MEQKKETVMVELSPEEAKEIFLSLASPREFAEDALVRNNVFRRFCSVVGEEYIDELKRRSIIGQSVN